MFGYSRIVDRYQKLRADRVPLAEKFLNGERPYMIFHTPPGRVWVDCKTPQESFEANMEGIEASLDIPSDHLPVMEPWFGTGVYANMYGCDYVWRVGEAPAVHYRYHNIEEIQDIKKPRWEDSDIANLVLDTIKYFKTKTGDDIPIIWTDTQSAGDTATLVLDASETFIGCMLEPEVIMNFMNGINKLIIEFSQFQAELIGKALVMPGHIMLSNAGLKGFSISDDNLAVASPDVNCKFNLLLDEELGRAMGGVAIHSCGNWVHTMHMVKRLVPSCVAIDCAVDHSWDPSPCKPETVRDAFTGTGIHVHARMTSETDKMLEIVKRLLHPELKLIIHPIFTDIPTAEQNYYELERLMSDFYRK